jgi:CheY-like chemotaxis protein
LSEHKQILIVDDEPVWLKVLGQLLQTKGYTVKEAASGADALNALKSYEPDLILLDVRMPDMNGFDLLDHIKKLPKLASRPVVFVSAMDDFHAKKVARELGAADYILKPIDETEVNNVLEKYLPL